MNGQVNGSHDPSLYEMLGKSIRSVHESSNELKGILMYCYETGKFTPRQSWAEINHSHITKEMQKFRDMMTLAELCATKIDPMNMKFLMRECSVDGNDNDEHGKLLTTVDNVYLIAMEALRLSGRGG